MRKLKKTLVAIAAAAVLTAPIVTYAEKDIMFGGGFGVVGTGGASAAGFTFGAQMKLNDAAGISLDYAEGDLFIGTYRGYLDNYADGPFWEAGVVTGGGSVAATVGGGIDIAQSNNLVFRVRGGVVIGEGGTGFGAAVTANYIP